MIRLVLAGVIGGIVSAFVITILFLFLLLPGILSGVSARHGPGVEEIYDSPDGSWHLIRVDDDLVLGTTVHCYIMFFANITDVTHLQCVLVASDPL